MPATKKTSKTAAPKKKKKKLTAKDLLQYLQTMSSDQSKAIQDEIAAAEKETTDRQVGEAKEALEFYYKVKAEVEDDCFERLEREPSNWQHGYKALANRHKGLDVGVPWSKSKILKIIAGLPAKKPTTDIGFVKAAQAIQYGKPRKWSKAVKEKRKLAAEAKKTKDTQTIARGAMFKQKESDKRQAKKASAKKKPTTKKISRPKPKSAGAMAVGDDGLTKHQRYETKRVMTPDQVEAKNEARRKRRAAGQSG